MISNARKQFMSESKLDLAALDNTVQQTMLYYPSLKVEDLCLQLLQGSYKLYSIYKSWKERNARFVTSNTPLFSNGASQAHPGPYFSFLTDRPNVHQSMYQNEEHSYYCPEVYSGFGTSCQVYNETGMQMLCSKKLNVSKKTGDFKARKKMYKKKKHGEKIKTTGEKKNISIASLKNLKQFQGKSVEAVLKKMKKNGPKKEKKNSKYNMSSLTNLKQFKGKSVADLLKDKGLVKQLKNLENSKPRKGRKMTYHSARIIQNKKSEVAAFAFTAVKPEKEDIIEKPKTATLMEKPKEERMAMSEEKTTMEEHIEDHTMVRDQVEKSTEKQCAASQDLKPKRGRPKGTKKTWEEKTTKEEHIEDHTMVRDQVEKSTEKQCAASQDLKPKRGRPKGTKKTWEEKTTMEEHIEDHTMVRDQVEKSTEKQCVASQDLKPKRGRPKGTKKTWEIEYYMASTQSNTPVNIFHNDVLFIDTSKRNAKQKAQEKLNQSCHSLEENKSDTQS